MLRLYCRRRIELWWGIGVNLKAVKYKSSTAFFIENDSHLEDAPSLAKYANNRKIWQNIRDAFPSPYTLDHAKDYIKGMQEMESQRIFAITLDGAAIGSIGIHPNQLPNKRYNAELGYWLGEEFWRQGIITEALRLIKSYGFSILALHKIFAEVYDHNIGSMRALEKAGFRKEVILKEEAFKNNRIVDVHRYFALKTSENIA